MPHGAGSHGTQDNRFQVCNVLTTALNQHTTCLHICLGTLLYNTEQQVAQEDVNMYATAHQTTLPFVVSEGMPPPHVQQEHMPRLETFPSVFLLLMVAVNTHGDRLPGSLQPVATSDTSTNDLARLQAQCRAAPLQVGVPTILGDIAHSPQPTILTILVHATLM